MKLSYGGRTALVLGGGSDMGLELVGRLLEEGLRVVPTHASDTGRAAITERFPDLTSPRAELGGNGFQELEPYLKDGVDYLVDLAQADLEALLPSTGQEADAYLEAHIAGRLRLLRAVTRSMLPRRFGRLVFVSSAAAALPAPGQGLYGAAKRAGEGLYRSMGVELGPRGITAVSLRLGLLDAGRGKRFLDGEDRRKRLGDRLVSLDQAVSTLVFLLSDQALALTCTTITMDAGLTAQKYL
jgi:3-oxoacyl-[acyl-carrier protein] reductase